MVDIRIINLSESLYEPIWVNDLPRVKELLADGADINYCRNKHGTPLMQAVYEAHIEMIRFLLERGADVLRVTQAPIPTSLEIAEHQAVKYPKDKDTQETLKIIQQAVAKAQQQELDQIGHSKQEPNINII